VKFRFVIEGGRHAEHRAPAATVPIDGEARRAGVLAEIEDGWRSMLDEADAQVRQRRRQWLGGAVKIYASSFGLDAEVVTAELTERLGSLSSQRSPEGFSDGFRFAPPDPKRPKRQQRTVQPDESGSLDESPL